MIFHKNRSRLTQQTIQFLFIKKGNHHYKFWSTKFVGNIFYPHNVPFFTYITSAKFRIKWNEIIWITKVKCLWSNYPHIAELNYLLSDILLIIKTNLKFFWKIVLNCSTWIYLIIIHGFCPKPLDYLGLLQCLCKIKKLKIKFHYKC